MFSALLVALQLVSAGATTHGPGERPEAECKSAYGKTACGYHCVAAYGDVQCAKSPAGACQAAYGKIVCSDEGDDGERVPPCCKRVAPVWPKAQCTSAYGQTVCGYGCVAGFGEVRCARTPAGNCRAAYGAVTCGDPARYWPGIPTVECRAGYGKVACGYGCVAGYGDVKCAGSPNGTCQAAYGEIVCSE